MVLDFLVEELQSCANSFCPVGEGTHGTTWQTDCADYPTASTGQYGWVFYTQK